MAGQSQPLRPPAHLLPKPRRQRPPHNGLVKMIARNANTACRNNGLPPIRLHVNNRHVERAAAKIEHQEINVFLGIRD